MGQSAVQPGRSAQPDARQQGPRVDDVEDPQRQGSRPGAATRPTSSPTGSRFRAAAGRRRSTIRRRRSSRSSTRAIRRIICSSTTTPTRRCISTSCSVRSSAGSTPRCTTRRRTSRKRSAGAVRCSTPTATARSRSRGTSATRRQFGAVPGRHGRQAAAGARGRGAPAPFDRQARHDGQLRDVLGDSESGRRHASGASANSIPAFSSGCSAATMRRRPARRRSSRSRSRASILAASTSIATASSGRRWPPAAIWRASTSASART